MALELKNLTKRVGAETHIHDTNLVLAEQGFNILLGTTLSGKTTLMQLMAGIDKPTSGEIWFKGANVTGTPVQKRNVSVVHQQFINYPNFNVFDNIASPLRVAKVPKSELGDRVAQVAALLQLTPLLKRMPNELSGGPSALPSHSDGYQRAGLSEARAAVVAADRRRQRRHLHAAGSHGPPGRRNGPDHVPHAGRGRERQSLWRVRPASQRSSGPV